MNTLLQDLITASLTSSYSLSQPHSHPAEDQPLCEAGSRSSTDQQETDQQLDRHQQQNPVYRVVNIIIKLQFFNMTLSLSCR